MPKTPRDYKAEYRRRLERGRARGLTQSQARGHPRQGEPLASYADRLPDSSPEIESALRLMRTGSGIGAAASEAGVGEKRLRKFIRRRNLATRTGKVWRIHDPRTRRIAVQSHGRIQAIFVDGFNPASKAGQAWDLQGRFTQTNDIDLLNTLRGQGVTDTRGRFHPFETDPNALHRIAATDETAFHEIYQIVS